MVHPLLFVLDHKFADRTSINMINFESHSVWLMLPIISLALLSVAESKDPDSSSDKQDVDELLISKDLGQKPDLLYEELKLHLLNAQATGFGIKVNDLGSLTIEQLVGACGSIEGTCDVTHLSSLDHQLNYANEGQKGSEDWRIYLDYCRNKWISKCNADDEMVKRISTTFTQDQWLEARELVDDILRQPAESKDPQALNVKYRYPQGVVKFMRSKDSNLDEILEQKKDKRDLFGLRYAQIVEPVCNQVINNLEHVVMGLKWAYNGKIPTENLAPTVQSGYKIFKICLKITLEKDKLVGLSYDFFSGKTNRGGLMKKLKGIALSGRE